MQSKCLIHLSRLQRQCANFTMLRADLLPLQVNWARWLISWGLELKDAKYRPTGSPPGDSALSKLANQICNFPAHNTGCKFAEYASKVLPRPVSKVCPCVLTAYLENFSYFSCRQSSISPQCKPHSSSACHTIVSSGNQASSFR